LVFDRAAGILRRRNANVGHAAGLLFARSSMFLSNSDHQTHVSIRSFRFPEVLAGDTQSFAVLLSAL
jgi:hypothetical protein